MTETQFQKARKIIQQANHLRGMITKAEGEVAKWTRMEGSHRENLRENQANGCNKVVLKAIEKLNERRKKFADMKFPEDIPDPPIKRCAECGCKIAEGNEYCGECMCENDGYI